MATPAEIEGKTLAELREMRTIMSGARWLLELEEEDQVTREQAAKEQLRVHHAIMRLENARLREIRDKLVENEADLGAGRVRLENARQNLDDARQVLDALSAFLGVVGRVVTLIV